MWLVSDEDNVGLHRQRLASDPGGEARVGHVIGQPALAVQRIAPVLNRDVTVTDRAKVGVKRDDFGLDLQLSTHLIKLHRERLVSHLVKRLTRSPAPKYANRVARALHH